MIKVLPQNIADQIAAGEVVERPASVIKELVENSLDAQATHVEIHVENGGKTSLKVIDDGVGMSGDDVEKSILRHATSKIQDIEDLFSVQSFGFRGEALAAISAVSDFELTSKKVEQNFGSKIKVTGGKKDFHPETPANNGTQILIKDLFNTTPARRQYLKTDETEYREILKEVKAFALANFEVGFRLFKDGKNVLDYPKTSNPKQRIQQCFAKKAEALTPVEFEASGLKVHGFINRPEYCVANRNQQYLFVNQRKIVDHKLAFAVREAFNQSCGIEKHLHPFFVLFIEIDPILVDVNVHPRKLEVKFSEPRDVFAAVSKATRDSLLKTSQIQSYGLQDNEITRAQDYKGKKVQSHEHSSFTTQNVPKIRNSKFEIRNSSHSPDLFHQSISQTPSFSAQDSPSSIDDTSLGELKLIGQVARKYIVAESENGVFFFDQHALHERQRFEHFWEKITNQKDRTQNLLIKQEIKLTEEQISLLNENQKTLKETGFSFQFPADNTIAISAIPNFLENEDLEKCLESIVEFLENESIGEHHADILLRKIVEYKACRGAIMFGDSLETIEMQKILEDLKDTKFKWLCAHGRPNYWFIPFEDLDRKFHR